MANGLTTQGDASSSTNTRASTYSEFLKAIEDAEASQSDFENTLQKLRISNVQNLGNLKKQQEMDLIQKTTDMQVELAKKVNQEKFDSLQEEYDTRMAMEDEAFAAKYNMTKEQYKKE